jgi:hypothetical protein
MVKKQQKANWSFSLVFAGVVLVLLFGGLIALVVWQRQGIPTHDEEQRAKRIKNLADLSAENQKVLTQYHWVDKNKGVVGVPIDRAMQLVLSDLQSNRPHPAGPINPPTPAPAPAASPLNQGTQPAQPAPSPAKSSPSPTQQPK